MPLPPKRRLTIVRKPVQNALVSFTNRHATLRASPQRLPAPMEEGPPVLSAVLDQSDSDDDLAGPDRYCIMDANLQSLAVMLKELQKDMHRLGRHAESIQLDNVALLGLVDKLKAEMTQTKSAHEQVSRESAWLRAQLVAKDDDHHALTLLQHQAHDKLLRENANLRAQLHAMTEMLKDHRTAHGGLAVSSDAHSSPAGAVPDGHPAHDSGVPRAAHGGVPRAHPDGHAAALAAARGAVCGTAPATAPAGRPTSHGDGGRCLRSRLGR
jgi:hypothetical protein